MVKAKADGSNPLLLMLEYRTTPWTTWRLQLTASDGSATPLHPTNNEPPTEADDH